MTDVILVRARDITMGQTISKIKELRAMMPNFEIFLDGDLNAIVGRCKI